jgi:hypothetical protein
MADIVEEAPARDTAMGDEGTADQEKIQNVKPKYKSFRYAQFR